MVGLFSPVDSDLFALNRTCVVSHLFPPISYFGQLLNQLIESRYCFSHIRVIYKSPMPYSTDEGCEAVKVGGRLS